MDTTHVSSPHCLTDRELVARVKDLAGREQRATACLVAHLAELDERRLYFAEGCNSLYAYCTEVLHLSEYAAINRIEAARAARRFPLVLERLAEGVVHLAAVRILAPHLTDTNHRDLLEEATHKSKRQVEEMIARLRPRPAVESSVRKLPRPGSADSAGIQDAPALELSGASAITAEAAPRPEQALSSLSIAPADSADAAGHENEDVRISNCPSATPAPHRAKVAALASDLFKVQFTADADTHRLLCQARELLRHQIPDGDVAAVLALALKVLVDKLERQKFGAGRRRVRGRREVKRSDGSCDRESTRGGSRSRHIPAAVKREVWKRDGGQCAFVGHAGRRCTERGRLEFHHVEAFARGGPATVDNIHLRCRAHNAYEAELIFGSQPVVVLGHKSQLAPGRVGPGAGPSHSPP